MRAVTGLFAAVSPVLTPALAFAHGAHPTELDGHSHWIGFAALGAVIAIAALAAWGAEGRKASKQRDAASETLEG